MQPRHSPIPRPGTLVAAIVTTEMILLWFLNGAMVQPAVGRVLKAIHGATGGLIEPTLIAGVFSLSIVATILFGPGGLHPRDVGWRIEQLPGAAVWTVAFWTTLQLCYAAAAVTLQMPLELATVWSSPGPGYAAGGFIAQVFGNAWHEETVYRGFLIAALAQMFHGRTGRGRGQLKALVAALVVSQLLFAVSHVPNRLFIKGVHGAALVVDQVRLFVWGLLFATFYLATGNLFAAVGIHALWNDPLPVLRIQETNRGLAPVVTLLFIVLSLALKQCRRCTSNGELNRR